MGAYRRGRTGPRAAMTPSANSTSIEKPLVGEARLSNSTSTAGECFGVTCQAESASMHVRLPPMPAPCATIRLSAVISWEPIVEGGEIAGVICPDCLTLRERRAIRAEQARILRRLKRGLPLDG